ncbi:MAG: hypothetical protein LH468_12365 [Nocardioides sp.]|nr:hypothetical protein [Nocardioides sp.]
MSRPSIPPVVYVPTLHEDDGTTRVRMQRMRDDTTALFVYSALDRLQDQYGDDAGWVLLRADTLDDLYAGMPFDLLFLDRELSPAKAG